MCPYRSKVFRDKSYGHDPENVVLVSCLHCKSFHGDHVRTRVVGSLREKLGVCEIAANVLHDVKDDACATYARDAATLGERGGIHGGIVIQDNACRAVGPVASVEESNDLRNSTTD